MPLMIGGAMAAGGMGLGALGSMFGSSGAKKQLALMREALDYQKGIDKRTYNDLSPYRQFGGDQLNALSGFLSDKNPSNYIDPGYQFRLDAGTNAINNNAATKGMLQSGDTLRALTEYGQDMGSQEYGNAFNRWLGEGQFRQGLTGIGQNAATQGGGLANQGAQNVAGITANMDAGAPDKIWGDYISNLGGMATKAGFGGMGGSGGMMSGMGNAFQNIFSQQSPQQPDWYQNALGGYTGR